MLYFHESLQFFLISASIFPEETGNLGASYPKLFTALRFQGPRGLDLIAHSIACYVTILLSSFLLKLLQVARMVLIVSPDRD